MGEDVSAENLPADISSLVVMEVWVCVAEEDGCKQWRRRYKHSRFEQDNPLFASLEANIISST